MSKNNRKSAKRPDWARTHHAKPKRVDRRARAAARKAKGA